MGVIHYNRGVYGGGGGNIKEMTTEEYEHITPQQDIAYFLYSDNSNIDELDVNEWVGWHEPGMDISVVDDKLTFTWSGAVSIGANAGYQIPIPKDALGITYKLTTGTSYSHTALQWKIGVGVKTFWSTSGYGTPADSNWVEINVHDENNATIEDTLDLSNVSVDTYLYLCGHGWNMVVEEIGIIYDSYVRRIILNDKIYVDKSEGDISYGTDIPSGGRNGDTYIQLNENRTMILTIWENVNNTWVSLDGKQDKLIAGTNITIGQDGKTISATDTDKVSELTDVELTDLADGQVLKWDATNEKWINDDESGGASAESMTSAEYNALPQSEKTDATKIHFIDDSTAQEIETPINMSQIYNRAESSMSVSVVNGELVYRWLGGGAIGASSYYPVVIPANVQKIKYKITTGTSYSTTTQRFKIAIGVKSTYSTSAWATAEDTNWLAVDIQNTQNTEYEGEVDLTNIATDSYLMIGAHGWTVTFNEISTVTESQATGDTKIMYKDKPYGEAKVLFDVVNGELCQVYDDGQ